MGNILLSEEINNAIKKEFSSAMESVQLVTAYCKSKSFSKINEYINDSVKEKKLLLRFRLDDLAKGSTDFDVIESALKKGWDVFVRFDLHAKTFIVDHKRCIIGSANITNAGIGTGNFVNQELATLVEIDKEDFEKINYLFCDAIRINNDILKELRYQYDNLEKNGDYKSVFWSKSITSLFEPRIKTLFSYEFPDTADLIYGEYLSFLDEVYYDAQEIKESVRWCKAYRWLIQILKENDGELYFGKVSEILHNSLVNDPKPYRKDVKELLSNLLEIITKLGMEEISIDRPNYSQRIRLNNS